MCGQKRGAIEGQGKTGFREMNYLWELGKGRLVQRGKAQVVIRRGGLDGQTDTNESRFELTTSIPNGDGPTDNEKNLSYP